MRGCRVRKKLCYVQDSRLRPIRYKHSSIMKSGGVPGADVGCAQSLALLFSPHSCHLSRRWRVARPPQLNTIA